MLSNQMQRQYKIWGSIIVAFYVVCFGFLVIHNFQVWTLAPFIESLIGVFMGAGAIAVITGIILIFQSSIQAEQEKKQEVFKEKMKLYSSIIDKMNEIKRDGQVSSDERLDIMSIQSKIALLSNQTTFDKFIDFQSNLTDDEGNINENYSDLMMDFIGSARDDLEVQETMTIEQKRALEETKEKSKKVAESYSKPYQRTMYSGFEEWKNIQKENAPKSKKENIFSALTIVELLHNSVIKHFENQDGFQMKYGKTSGCTGYAKEKKFLAISYSNTGWIYVSVLKDYKENYRLPNIKYFTTEHIRNYKPEKSSTAAFGEQFHIKANSLDVFDKNICILLKFINRSFELATEFKDKILKIYDSDNLHKSNENDLIKQKEYLDPNYRYDFNI